MYKELVHMVTEAEKFQELQGEVLIGNLGGGGWWYEVQSESEGLRTGELMMKFWSQSQ